MKSTKHKRLTCKFCSISLSRSHFYAYGHNKGICSQNTIKSNQHNDLNSAKKIKASSDECQSSSVEYNNEEDFHVDYDIVSSESENDVESSRNSNSESSETEIEDSGDEDSDGEFWSDVELDLREERAEFQNPSDNENHEIIAKILTSIFLYQTLSKSSDSSITILIGVVRYFLYILINFAGITDLQLEGFPSTLYSCKRHIGLETDNQFIKWVICQKCDSIYSQNESVKCRNGRQFSANCKNVMFPNHTIKNRRAPCNTKLMKKVTNGSKFVFHSRKLYCYKSIKTTLEILLRRPGFRELLLTDIVSNDNDIRTDIYDGYLWKNFKGSDGNLFFSDKRNIGLMLNVDWFQPFKNCDYSLGAIYMVFLNLPREERFKWENVIVCGIIPGPKEPKLNINSYLKPIVDELIEGWKGIYINDGGIFHRSLYKFALVCLSSDIPATRKCGGFLNFNACRGCSKCWKEFPREAFGDQPDYSGFNEAEFRPRYGMAHKLRAEETLTARTKGDKQRLEKRYGLRYSELYRLEYFDPIRMHVVDVMHNIFLGTAKHMFKVWIKNNIITKNHSEVLTKLQKSVSVPSGQGRIACNIISTYKRMKADEWKNFVLIYSSVCLKEILSVEQFKHWCLFINCCSIICQKSISVNEIEQFHSMIHEFCVGVEEIYGKEFCTPNIHLHMHIKNCLLDFGPVYSFWCFSFEKFNSIMGAYHTNNKDIVVTMMRKFCNEAEILSRSHSDYYKFIGKYEKQNKAKCISQAMVTRHSMQLNFEDYVAKPKSICKKSFLTDSELKDITDMSKKLFGDSFQKVLRHVERFKRIEFFTEVFATLSYRNGTSPDKNVLLYCIKSKTVRPAEILGLLKVEIMLTNDKKQQINLVECRWLARHVYTDEFGRDCNLKVWNTIFDNSCSQYLYILLNKNVLL